MTAALYIYYTPDWQPLADIVLPVAKRYADMHDYDDLFILSNNVDICGLGKMKHLRTILGWSTWDSVWILDLDTIITNPEIEFTDFVDNDHDVFICKDVHGINAGSWIVRNTPASRSFINKVITNFDAPEEQTVMKRYLDMVKVKYLPHPSINSYKYELYDEPECRGYTDGQWEPGHLLLHLPGTSMNKRIETFKKLI